MNKSLGFALFALSALALQADVMNWQVNDDNLSDCNYAKLYYADSNTTEGGTQLASSTLEEGVGDIKQIDLSQISGISPSSTYFYIEAGQYSGDNFAASKRMGAYSYSDLVSAGLISSGGLSTPSGLSFGQSGVTIAGSTATYGAVPEPGTATLILLGMAIAGLKRRRV